MRPLLTCLLLCALAACSADDDRPQDADVDAGPDASRTGGDVGDIEVGEDAGLDADADGLEPGPVDAPGPYAVGYRTLSIEYTPQTFDEPRELNVALWYPTTDTDGEAAIYRALIRRQGVYAEPEPAGDAPYPVLVFSHGNTGFAQQSYFLTERVASHGWLVIAPDHTGNTAADFRQSLYEVMRLFRPLDIRATLDAVAGLDNADPLAGRVGEYIALAGHSFGGYTTLAVGGATLGTEPWDTLCETETEGICPYWTEPRRALVQQGFADTRFKTLIPMTPARWAPMTPDSTAAITTPTFLMTSALDMTTSDAEHGDPIWEDFGGSQHLRASLATGGHYTFSNGCEFGIGVGDGCGAGFLDIDEAHDMINTLVVAWLRVQRTGDEDAAAFLNEAPAGVEFARKQ